MRTQSSPDKYTLVHLEDIEVPQGRQRTKSSEKAMWGLSESITNIGLIHPLVITRGGVLVTGGRRLAAIKSWMPDGDYGAFGTYPYIPCLYVDELAPRELRAIELEENIRREDLPWQDRAAAVLRFRLDESMTAVEIGQLLGYTTGWVTLQCQVAEAIAAGRTDIAQLDNYGTALHMLEREAAREKESEAVLSSSGAARLEDLFNGTELTGGDFGSTQLGNVHGGDRDTDKSVGGTQAPRAVFEADFIEWASEYTGPKFTFLHCDFPYGIAHHSTDQGGADSHGAFSDNPEVFWGLVNALIENQDRLLAPNAHIMLWFSMVFYSALMGSFKAAKLRPDPFPLVWYKSNNQGIVPDAQRGPRRVYETALLVQRGDPRIVRTVPNACSFPLDKGGKRHISEKPVEVLAHFFRMLVDKNSLVLDPTCGSGSALVAAHNAGAKVVLGIELNGDYADRARTSLANAQLTATDEAESAAPEEADIFPHEDPELEDGGLDIDLSELDIDF